MKALELIKVSVDIDGDGKETIKDDLTDGYYTMAQRGAIPAAALGLVSAYKSKGLKNKFVHGLAGIGAGFLGTMAAKTGYDLYDRKKREHEAKKQREIAEALSLTQPGM